jgi:pimeloyl-ACP methyl ester carboxylesterase
MSVQEKLDNGNGHILLDGGRVGVLLIHGLGGTPVELKFVAQALNRIGHTVYCPLLVGHGGTGEDDSYHMVTLDRQRADVADRSVTFCAWVVQQQETLRLRSADCSTVAFWLISSAPAARIFIQKGSVVFSRKTLQLALSLRTDELVGSSTRPNEAMWEQIVRNIDCHVWSAGAGSNETLRAIIRWIGDDVAGRAFGW